MKHSVHRVNSRLTEDVLIPVRRYLIKNATYIKHSIAIGSFPNSQELCQFINGLHYGKLLYGI